VRVVCVCVCLCAFVCVCVCAVKRDRYCVYLCVSVFAVKDCHLFTLHPISILYIQIYMYVFISKLF